MEKAHKYRRLNQIRYTLPHVSQVALAKYCAKAASGELPEVHATRFIREARNSEALQDTKFGKLIVTISLEKAKGGTVDVEVVHPLAYLWAAAQCERYATFLRHALDTHVPSATNPWDIILYADEAKPGNRLKTDNRRSVQAVYMNILSLGSAVLSKEDTWLTLGAVRSCDIFECEGGMAQLFGALLKMMFSSTSHDLRYSGVGLDLHGGGQMRLFAKVGCILGDECALHSVWMNKGSGGTKCCIHCINITDKDWKCAPFVAGHHILKPYNQVCRLSDCMLHSRESVLDIIDKLVAAKHTLGKGEFGELEQLHGWSYSKHSLLVDPWLRGIVDPTQHNVFDWVHVLLQGLWHMLFISSC